MKRYGWLLAALLVGCGGDGDGNDTGDGADAATCVDGEERCSEVDLDRKERCTDGAWEIVPTDEWSCPAATCDDSGDEVLCM